MVVLICGDREWKNYNSIFNYIKGLKEKYGDDLKIIEGEAPGADTHARVSSKALGVRFQGYPANWRLFKKQAGPVRNAEMLRKERPDLVVAFHSNIEASKGTKDMVKKARDKGVEVEIYDK